MIFGMPWAIPCLEQKCIVDTVDDFYKKLCLLFKQTRSTKERIPPPPEDFVFAETTKHRLSEEVYSFPCLLIIC